MTFLTILERYGAKYDFTHSLGVLTRANLVLQFSKYLDPDLKPHLKECPSIWHMLTVISTNTDALTIERSDADLKEFEIQVTRIIKFAKLPRI